MIKVEVIEPFCIKKFNELTDILRAGVDEEGKLFIGDTFECTKEMYEYLTKTNSLGRAFVKLIEVIPEAKIEQIEEKPKRRKRKTE